MQQLRTGTADTSAQAFWRPGVQQESSSREGQGKRLTCAVSSVCIRLPPGGLSCTYRDTRRQLPPTNEGSSEFWRDRQESQNSQVEESDFAKRASCQKVWEPREATRRPPRGYRTFVFEPHSLCASFYATFRLQPQTGPEWPNVWLGQQSSTKVCPCP